MAKGTVIDVTCRCGATACQLNLPSPKHGTRLVCYCKDCQTAARHLGAADQLMPGGGTDIFQTLPAYLRIVKGQENLAILRLSPKGLMRWHATCCGTPIMNTLENLNMPFVGMVLGRAGGAKADKDIGPVRHHVFTATAQPEDGAPTKDAGFTRVGLRFLLRVLGAYLTGRAKKMPLRAPSGGPIAPVHVITLEERQAAQP